MQGDREQKRRDLVARIHALFISKQVTIATAESCTSGMLAVALTDQPGSSAYYMGGVNAYANKTKSLFLKISPDLIEKDGAVSKAVAEEMAIGVRQALGTHIGVSLTGIAGPGGGSPEKPVGTVWLGLANSSGVSAHLLQLSGSRQEIREKATIAALEHIEQWLEKYVES